MYRLTETKKISATDIAIRERHFYKSVVIRIGDYSICGHLFRGTWFFPTFGGYDGVNTNLFSKRLSEHLPYICRFKVLSLFTFPSTGPLLQARLKAFSIALRSCINPFAKLCSSAIEEFITFIIHEFKLSLLRSLSII